MAPRPTSLRAARSLGIALLVALGGARGHLRAESAQDDPARTAEKLVEYLDQRPFHERAFEQLYRIALETGTRTELQARYAARIEADAKDTAARVLLARLEARARRPREALALLEPIARDGAPDDRPALDLLAGRLHVELLEVDPALVSLRRAADSACRRGAVDDLRIAEDALEQLAGAWLLKGDPDAAAACLVEYAELDPTDFARRMEAAAQLAGAGLEEAALAQLARAEELAQGDAPREVRAIVEAADILERRGELDAAEAHLARATARLGPGHWQRSGLFDRRLALHQRLGTLDRFVADLAAASELDRSDPEARLHLARALSEQGDEDRALELLARGAEAFPESRELAEALAERLAAKGEIDAAVAELQRIAAAQPTALGLHRAAGILLAGDGRIAAAREQWSRELARSPTDAGLLLDVAELLCSFGSDGEAIVLLRRGLEAAPLDMRLVRALVERSGSTEALARAERVALAQSDPDALEELAADRLERDEIGRAIELLEAAIDCGGDEERLLASLVGIQSVDASPEEALARLLRHAELAVRPQERVERVARYVAACKQSKRLTRALQYVESATDPLALAVHAHVLDALDRPAEADAALGRLAVSPGHEEEALRHAAHIATEHAARDPVRSERAIVAWEDVARLGAAQRVEARGVISRLHRRCGRLDEARSVEDALLADAPRNLVLLREFAARELTAPNRKERDHERARVLLERIIALDPGDSKARMDLAGVFLSTEDRDGATAALLPLLAVSDDETRERAREFLMERVLRHQRAVLSAEWVRRRIASEPSSLEYGLLHASLLREAGLDREAHAVLARLRSRYPNDPALVAAQRDVLGLTRESILEHDRKVLARPTTATADEIAVLRHAHDALLLGDVRAAERFLADVPAIAAANLLLVHGEAARAARRLEHALRGATERAELVQRLAVAFALAGNEPRAVIALEELLQGDSSARSRWSLRLELGEHMAELGSRSGLRRVGLGLFADLMETRHLVRDPNLSVSAVGLHERRVAEVVQFHLQHGLERDFVRSGLLTLPEDLAVTVALLDHDWGMRPSELERAKARMSVRPFSVWTSSEWRREQARLAPDEEGERASRWAQVGPSDPPPNESDR